MANERYVDPVCGMEITNIKDAIGPIEYMGKKYYFCEVEDKEKFEKNPMKYVKSKKEEKVKSMI
ncbi:MAG: hypothetical protein A2474_05645 [Elusimicrobia bacterium RIFOXYC2_FULL_34_12]|nr:MAG: hypothetical protein A2474_05645 [Elusimicrobia bacterium RIFOXYC2_FULL_34_12]OGS38732.1 MAG: hypothetical protein A2551_04570 [Elusimicrobia bacterium RIFOXYD2_FULL_34_30]HAM38619.1 YHS domain-containing protein [Elusimicrobiota bacterium]